MNRLTFVIPAFGESQHLEECIASLLKQSVKCKIIICTSTPNNHIALLSERFSIPVTINPDGGTIGKDWNFALKTATTELVTLAHQDDLYHPLYAEKIIALFNQNRHCALAFTDSSELINGSLVNNNKRELVKKILRKLSFLNSDVIKNTVQYAMLLGLGCSIPCPSVTYNKNTIGNFSFSDDFSVNLDWDAWTRLAKSKVEIGYVRGALITHRIHEDAETQKGIAEKRREKEDLILFSQYWPSPMAKLLLKIYRFSY